MAGLRVRYKIEPCLGQTDYTVLATSYRSQWQSDKEVLPHCVLPRPARLLLLTQGFQKTRRI